MPTEPWTSEPPALSGELFAQAADYDTWCEFGTKCTRKISSYISETKGNAAYGDSSGTIGTFDVILLTNLNGRQAQWRVFWYHDTGPALSFHTPM